MGRVQVSDRITAPARVSNERKGSKGFVVRGERKQPFLTHAGHGLTGHEVLVGNDLGPDDSPLHIRAARSTPLPAHCPMALLHRRARVEPVHGSLDPFAKETVKRRDRSLQQDIDSWQDVLGKRGEDVLRRIFAGSRAPNTDLQSTELIGSQRGEKRENPLVAAGPALAFETEPAQIQSKIIVHHHKVLGRHPVRIQKRRDHGTGLIHPGHGRCQDDLGRPTATRK